MSTEVKVPVLPESVSDATIATWHKKVGDAVARDENLVDLETDKVVLEVPSPADGVIKELKFAEGDTVTGQQVIAIIEAGAAPAAKADKADKAEDKAEPEKSAGKAKSAEPAKPATPAKAAPSGGDSGKADLSPAGRRVAEQHDIDTAEVSGSGRGGRITKEDLLGHMSRGASARPEERVAMTRIRKRIAERLMESKNSIAMLTSFNEVNLAEVVKLRKSMGEAFEKANGIKLGFMSFFVKAAANALQRYPVVNASVDGDDVIYHGYADISIAVATEKGLVTPVLRNAERMGFADIEQAIAEYAKKARDGKLSLEDLQGGTFTITNGGTFGSLFSTPIVNPPQSAILGMHAIKERAVVENGQVVAAPMMYIAISYDHRIIDGKDAVLFLVDIKNQLENPHRMLLGL
ncbi:MAG: 2-oxoglutarate dehydrogenase complex dihydrolipoyllysine-residue succinyltransferase [Xanthomonadaceae bacterium]|nr:2-oxoglutarate dehydrogenase complex dihydrolipoyllysine-residue succinyltransferase [Xanthomonadaceae bacterium]